MLCYLTGTVGCRCWDGGRRRHSVSSTSGDCRD